MADSGLFVFLHLYSDSLNDSSVSYFSLSASAFEITLRTKAGFEGVHNPQASHQINIFSTIKYVK